jgi:hypothetical protein
MLAVSTAAGVVLNGVTYAASVKVTLTLPGGVYPDVSLAVSDLRITSAKATDGPDQSTYQVGWPTASADFTLSGLVDKTDATKTAAWLFGRWQTTSPLYRTDALLTAVTIDIVLGIPGATETIRKFTGFVGYYTRQGSAVAVTCVDRSVLLRASSVAVSAVATASPWNAGLTSEFALDSVARGSTGGVISSWPVQRPQCAFAAGFRSSVWAEAGTLDTSFKQPAPSFQPAAFGSALILADEGRTYPGTEWPQNVWATASGVGSNVFIEFWVTGIHDDAVPDPSVYLQLLSADGFSEGVIVGVYGSKVTVQVISTSGSVTRTWTVATDGAAHYFALTLAWATGNASCTLSAQMDGTVHPFTAITTGIAARSLNWTQLRLSKFNGVGTNTTVEALQVTNEVSPTPSYPFVPQAVFDPSLNTLQVVPGIDAGTDPRALLSAIATAELGNIGFDENGILRFVNRTNWQQQTVARTVTASNLAAIGEETTAASVINHGQVGFTGWSTQAKQTVWSLTRPWRIPARSTGRNAVIRYVTLPEVTVNVPTTVAAYPNSGAPAAGANAYAASLDVSGINAHPGLTITATQVGSQRVKLRIVNNTANPAYMVSPATTTGLTPGTPTLIIGGQPVTQDTEATADYQYPSEDDGGAISSRFGEQLWSSTGDPWIQDADTAQQLVQDVVQAGYQPRPNLTGLEIVPPDPRIQNGDLLHVQDAVTTIVDEYVRAFGWELTVNQSGMAQSIDSRALAPPGGWIGGLAGRSEGGVTTYGY